MSDASWYNLPQPIYCAEKHYKKERTSQHARNQEKTILGVQFRMGEISDGKLNQILGTYLWPIIYGPAFSINTTHTNVVPFIHALISSLSSVRLWERAEWKSNE